MPHGDSTHFSTTRRGFLRLVGATTSLGVLAQLRSVPAAAASPEAHSATGFFSAGEHEILTQVVERMIDSGQPGAPRVRDTATVATIDALCGSLDPSITQLLPALLHVVDYAPFVFELELKRFTHMTPSEQDASLEGWMRSRFALRRTAFLALRNLSFLGYYSQEETWPLIGYAGPLLRPDPEPA